MDQYKFASHLPFANLIIIAISPEENEADILVHPVIVLVLFEGLDHLLILLLVSLRIWTNADLWIP